MKQIRLFRVALLFFTRIPVGEIKDFQESDLNHASRYFTWVGVVVGVVNAGVFLVADLLFSQPIAVLLTMMTSLLLTGCFHEDGLADTIDGFGGGFTLQRKLDIMKDSRQGTYGVAALWVALTLKWALLCESDAVDLPLILIVGHVFSRFVPGLMIKLLPYVRDEKSKSKPLATESSWGDLVILALVLIPGFIVRPLECLVVIGALAVTYWLWTRFIRRQIGGYTGDVLGAAQQISELVVYATWLVIVSCR